MGIAIAIRITQEGSILTYTDEIHTPCVDTDAGKFYLLFCYDTEATEYLAVKGIDVPIEMAAELDYLIRKTRKLTLLQLSLLNGTQDGSAAGSSQIDSKKILLVFHYYINMYWLSLTRCKNNTFFYY